MSFTLRISTNNVADQACAIGRAWKYEEMGSLWPEKLLPDSSMRSGSTEEFWTVENDLGVVQAWAYVKFSNIQYMREHRCELEIKHLQVHSKSRRRGIGSFVIAQAKKRAVQDNLRKVVLQAAKKNHLVRFYMTNGMKLAPEIPSKDSALVGEYVWFKLPNASFVEPTVLEQLHNFEQLLRLKNVAGMEQRAFISDFLSMRGVVSQVPASDS